MVALVNTNVLPFFPSSRRHKRHRPRVRASSPGTVSDRLTRLLTVGFENGWFAITLLVANPRLPSASSDTVRSRRSADCRSAFWLRWGRCANRRHRERSRVARSHACVHCRALCSPSASAVKSRDASPESSLQSDQAQERTWTRRQTNPTRRVRPVRLLIVLPVIPVVGCQGCVGNVSPVTTAVAHSRRFVGILGLPYSVASG